jgi:hypothetical protein
MNEVPKKCPACDLVLLYGHIFDAFDMKDRYGPILRIHKDAEPKTAKAGYLGFDSMWRYDSAPDFYRCPRCGVDPIALARSSSSTANARDRGETMNNQ